MSDRLLVPWSTPPLCVTVVNGRVSTEMWMAEPIHPVQKYCARPGSRAARPRKSNVLALSYIMSPKTLSPTRASLLVPTGLAP